MEKPSAGKIAKVPISDTGTAIMGISVAPPVLEKQVDHQNDERHCRGSVTRISWMPSVTGSVVSSAAL